MSTERTSRFSPIRMAVIAFAIAAVATLTQISPALAAGDAVQGEASISPELFHCQPLTAANEVTPPPPLPESEHTPQRAIEAQELPQLCPKGEIAYPEPIYMEHSEEAPGTDATELTAPPPIMPPKGNEEGGNPGYHYVESGTEQKVGGGDPGPLVGGSIEMGIGNVETPTGRFEIGPGGSHSIGQLAFANNGTAQDTVELGWTIDPSNAANNVRAGEPLDHLRPHLFTFVNRDGYNKSLKADCYDCWFVPAKEAKHLPGQILASTGPNTTFKFAVEFLQHQWWVWFAGEWIGYLEYNFWAGGTTEFTRSTYHQYYGEVFDNRGDGTDMGDGSFGGNENALLMRNPVGYPTAETPQNEELGSSDNVVPKSDAGVRYGIGNISADRRSWRFGGPGAGVVKDQPEYATGIGPGHVAAKAAELDAEINPNGHLTNYHFEYGPTASYGSSTATASAGEGWNPTAVSAQLTGLTKLTTYHYRLVATNSEGTIQSEDETFTTGAEWSSQSVPKPPTGTYTYLDGVSCQSVTACKAVGTFVNGFSPGGQPPLAETLSGTAWAAQEPPRAEGSTENVLLDISCPTSSWCMAVGLTKTSGVKRPLTEIWNGTSWSVQTPATPGSYQGELTGVSCRSSEWCMATGGIFPYEERMIVAHWNGKEWTSQEAPSPSGGSKDGASTSISCPTTSFCEAVGAFTGGSSRLPLAVKWNGVSWTAEEVPPAGGAEGEGGLAVVSCASATFCEAVLGVNQTYPQLDRWSGVTWNGSSWTKQSFPEPATTNAHLEEVDGLSCYAANHCLAVGNSRTGEGYSIEEKPLAVEFQAGRWILQEPPIPTGAQPQYQISLMEVSCVAGPACVAVGTSHPESGEAVPIAEVYK